MLGFRRLLQKLLTFAKISNPQSHISKTSAKHQHRKLPTTRNLPKPHPISSPQSPTLKTSPKDDDHNFPTNPQSHILKTSAKHQHRKLPTTRNLRKPLPIPSPQSPTLITSPKEDDHNFPNNLPKKLANKVFSLTCKSSADPGVCNVILVGVTHEDKETHELVQAVVRSVKPQAVFLELCRDRAPILKRRDVGGVEFRAAYEEAARYGGKVILGDLRWNMVRKRLSDKKILSEVTKFLVQEVAASLFPNSFPSLKNEIRPLRRRLEMQLKVTNDDEVDLDVVTTILQKASKVLPETMEVLVHERDKYMSKHLLKTASEHNSVVAVVGLGHVPGIKMNWKQFNQARELSDTSVQKPVAKTTT